MKKITTLFVLFSIAFFPSCGEPKEKPLTREEIMQLKIEDKLKRWRASNFRRCGEDVLAAAEAIVDSTLIAQARLGADSIYKPPRPEKPEKPEVKDLKDTSEVKPLFDTLPAENQIK